ncbi:MAG: hypothetical protein L3J03_02580 [Desulfobacterales bacterium]|nr:hypothetical protein [Desulfobacterales bacterium]
MKNNLLVAIVILILTVACAPITPQPVQESKIFTPDIKTIAFMPPEAAVPGPRLAAGVEVLSALLTEYTRSHPDTRMVDPVLLDSSRLETGSRETLARGIGREMGSDAVLITTLHRYFQRVGSAMSVQRSASVAFEMKLVAVSSGRVLWFGTFDETQQPVLENLFLLRRAAARGFRFITAEELAREGVAGKLGECPFLGDDNK